jgi:hypothetical protein
MTGRKNVVLAISVLACGLAGVALAGVGTHSTTRAGATVIDVSVLDGGKVKLSATSLPAGKLTLVVVNKGKLTHGLAIMGNGLSPKRTATLAVGKSARLVVTVKAGMYHVWDPVRSSMSHAKFLTVKAAAAASSSGGSYGGGSYGGGAGTTGGSSGSTGGGGGMDMGGDGMEGCDHG